MLQAFVKWLHVYEHKSSSSLRNYPINLIIPSDKIKAITLRLEEKIILHIAQRMSSAQLYRGKNP